MAEDTTQAVATSETDDQASSTAAAHSEAAAGSATTPQAAQEEAFDRARAQALIDKLRPFEKKATDQEKRAEKAERRLQEIEDAQKTDAEKRQDRLDALEKQQAEWQTERAALQRENAISAAMSGITVEDQEWLADKLARADLELDESGRPKPQSIDKVIGDLRKAHPTLFAGSATAGAGGTRTTPMASSGTPTNPARTQANSGVFTTAQLADHAFYKAHEKDILQAMREGRIVNNQ